MRTAIVTGAFAALIALVFFVGAGDPEGPNAFVVIGLSSGAVYGLVALGLVLVYKGARVFNFAQGEFGTLAAFILFVLIEQVTSPEIPYWAGVIAAIAGATAIGLIMERIVVRPLLNAPRVTLLVATIAFTLMVVGIELLLFLPEPKALPPILEALNEQGQPAGIQVFNYNLEPQNLLIIGVLGTLAGVLAYFFSKTDLGLAVLATSQDAFATRVVGIGVERMSRFIWGAAAFLGGVAGILYMPIAGALTPGGMTTGVLIPAFTAAVIGGMTSLPGAFLGGLAVGVIQQLSAWAAGNYSLGDELIQDIIPAAPEVSLFLALLLVLLIRPQGLLGREA